MEQRRKSRNNTHRQTRRHRATHLLQPDVTLDDRRAESLGPLYIPLRQPYQRYWHLRNALCRQHQTNHPQPRHRMHQYHRPTFPVGALHYRYLPQSLRCFRSGRLRLFAPRQPTLHLLRYLGTRPQHNGPAAHGARRGHLECPPRKPGHRHGGTASRSHHLQPVGRYGIVRTHPAALCRRAARPHARPKRPAAVPC